MSLIIKTQANGLHQHETEAISKIQEKNKKYQSKTPNKKYPINNKKTNRKLK